MNDQTWGNIRVLVKWLDESLSTDEPTEHDITLRILKLVEEIGEVANARIGVLGQNPRKGYYADNTHVIAELNDVILTAMVALESISADAQLSFEEHVADVVRRMYRSQPHSPVAEV